MISSKCVSTENELRLWLYCQTGRGRGKKGEREKSARADRGMVVSVGRSSSSSSPNDCANIVKTLGWGYRNGTKRPIACMRDVFTLIKP